MTEDQPIIFICGRHVVIREVDKQRCPTCKSDQEFLCEFEEWYGWTNTCLNCGDSWMEGELLKRPFMRGWRKQAVEEAKARINLPVETMSFETDSHAPQT